MIVLSAGVIGAIGGKIWPQRFAVSSGHGPSAETGGQVIADDSARRSISSPQFVRAARILRDRS